MRVIPVDTDRIAEMTCPAGGSAPLMSWCGAHLIGPAGLQFDNERCKLVMSYEEDRMLAAFCPLS